MIGKRGIRSLAQFLELQNADVLRFLLDKHHLQTSELLDAIEYRSGVLNALVTSLESGSEAKIVSLLNEIARTRWDLRYRVSPDTVTMSALPTWKRAFNSMVIY